MNKRGWIPVITRILHDKRGQDMIEYALLGGFIAVAVAAVFPMDIAPNISKTFSKVSNLLGQV
ncbi:MAG: Flp family type IVb pilin [Acidobacteria bacterium]|nr:Flp family type IVb pilin [Acidobacteriota bacterium]